ncbi:reprolysin-like metallopeptidase [Paenimyroides ceti]
MNFKMLFGLVLLLFNVFFMTAQNNFWTKTDKLKDRDIPLMDRTHFPDQFQLYAVNYTALKEKLLTAPDEFTQNASDVIIKLPNAEGDLVDYKVYSSPVMEKELQEKYPEIKTYKAIEAKTAQATVRISVTPDFGMHIMGSDLKGTTFYVDTYTKDLQNYILYKRKDISADLSEFSCLVSENTTPQYETNSVMDVQSNDNKFRSYRFAMACTVEFAAFHIAAAGQNSGTMIQKKQAVLSAMVVTVNRLNSIYERDMSVRLTLVANNDAIIFITSDNFTNDDIGYLIDESQQVIDTTIGNANYDIGHTVSIGDGGMAGLGVICITGSKATAATGRQNPVGDPFDIDYVAHEVGHQFGAEHTFNSNTGSCNGNRSFTASAEPGSGSTIMAYAGLCGDHNLQNNSDAYFHYYSISEMTARVKATSCAAIISSSNPTPVVDAGNNYTIPYGTPFKLTATGTDSNNPNSLTYGWEQTDTQWSTQPPTANNTTGPNFRSFTPTSSPVRYFPAYATVLAGSSSANGVVSTQWERLPMVPRTMNFGVSLRDNNTINGGQVSQDNMKVTFANTGPFLITYPNNLTNTPTEEWQQNQTYTVTWNVAGTTGNGINTSNVNISFSLDNGQTFIPLVENTPNDGSQTVTLPPVEFTSNNAYVKIEPVGNIYYTLSKKMTIIGDGVSSNDQFEFDNFRLYPNPSSDVVNIHFDLSTMTNIVFELYDLNGRLVYKDVLNNSNNVAYSLPMNQFSSGMYLLKINDGNHSVVKKIVRK